MPDVSMSTITKSGFSARTIRSASTPLRASRKRCPRSRSSVGTKRRLTGLSSTTRIVAPNLPNFHPCPRGPLPGQTAYKRTIMPSSCVNSVTKMSQRVGRREGSEPPQTLRSRETSTTRPGVHPTDYRCRPGGTAPLTGASSPAIEPLERGRLVSKTLDVDAVLTPYQFDVLMGDAELLGVSEQGDLMRRIGGESPEVREKSRPLDRENRVRGMHADQHGRPLMPHRSAGNDLQKFPRLLHRFAIEEFGLQIPRLDGDFVQHTFRRRLFTARCASSRLGYPGTSMLRFAN